MKKFAVDWDTDYDGEFIEYSIGVFLFDTYEELDEVCGLDERVCAFTRTNNYNYNVDIYMSKQTTVGTIAHEAYHAVCASLRQLQDEYSVDWAFTKEYEEIVATSVGVLTDMIMDELKELGE